MESELYRQLDDIRLKLVLACKTISIDGLLESPTVKKISNPYDIEVDVVGLLYNVEQDLQFPGYLKKQTEKYDWVRKLWPKPTREDFLNEALKMLNDLGEEIPKDKHLNDKEKKILYDAVEYGVTHLSSLIEGHYKMK
jgi:hypothetical protein